MASDESALFSGYKTTIADLPMKKSFKLLEVKILMKCQKRLGWMILTNGQVQPTSTLVYIWHFLQAHTREMIFKTTRVWNAIKGL